MKYGKKTRKEHNEHQRAVHRNSRGPMGGLRKNHNPLTPQGPSEEEEDEDKETHGLLEGLRTKLRPLTPHEPLEEDEIASEEEMERANPELSTKNNTNKTNNTNSINEYMKELLEDIMERAACQECSGERKKSMESSCQDCGEGAV